MGEDMRINSDKVGESGTGVISGSEGNHYQSILKSLVEANPADVQRIAATQIELLSRYYEEVLKQSKASFSSAIIAAILGLFFFITATVFSFIVDDFNVSIVGVISGLIIEFVSAINFYLYNRSSLQMAEYQERLDRTQRFLIANSICEGMESDVKQQARLSLVSVIANAGSSSSLIDVDKKIIGDKK